MTSSSGRMKILPSPMCPSPCFAAPRMALTVGSTNASLTAISRRTLGMRLGRDLLAAVQLRVLLLAVARHAADRDPEDLGGDQGLVHLVQLVRLDDGDDQLHAACLQRLG